MSATHGIKTGDIKSSDRHGTDQYVQISDGTGTNGHLAAYNADGSLTDTTILAGDVVAIISGGGGTGTWITETPSGTLDGSNTAFTLSHTPTSGSLNFTLNGNKQELSRWYTISGTSVTMTVAPISIDRLIATYQY